MELLVGPTVVIDNWIENKWIGRIQKSAQGWSDVFAIAQSSKHALGWNEWIQLINSGCEQIVRRDAGLVHWDQFGSEPTHRFWDDPMNWNKRSCEWSISTFCWRSKERQRGLNVELSLREEIQHTNDSYNQSCSILKDSIWNNLYTIRCNAACQE